MSLPITICDDSKFAQRMLASSLPSEWDVDISYADNGEQAIENIKQGQADVLFLDLNMPVMDGYQVMQQIRDNDLPTMVIVISGDVQPEARKRILALGALDFIAKPIKSGILNEILEKFGVFCASDEVLEHAEQKTPQTRVTGVEAFTSQADKFDALQELANVAMGRAGESFGKILNQFIELPVPKVNLLHANELQMALVESTKNAKVSAVSKGFVAQGLSGEAIILFNDANADSLSELLGYSEHDMHRNVEALMDLSNIIIGACLNALSDALQLAFSHNTPIILGMHCDVKNLVESQSVKWKQVLMIEIEYSIANHSMDFELLFLIPEHHADAIFERMISSKLHNNDLSGAAHG